LAEELTQAFSNEGITVWADFKDLQPGDQWRTKLEQAIKVSNLFLFLISPNFQMSSWQDFESQTALAKAWTDSKTKVLPVVTGASEPPPFLRSWVALKVDPEAEPLTWTKRVVDAVQSNHSRNSGPLPAKSKRERVKRLDEIGRAAKELASQPIDSLSSAAGR
jgi:hypothetical protein